MFKYDIVTHDISGNKLKSRFLTVTPDLIYSEHLKHFIPTQVCIISLYPMRRVID